ncbi:galactose mutarotase [Streptomyces sp. A7024]|uniref:Aldose 1-epimerase n=1 Tax=Streptomyces coryli TaxID=1128680 RepID=A0A6G4U7R1_9ACTN|nr:aldose epimerase family protein [Streptomyces coryli]NGN67428.1 galactose mutarotase [Streptomyces coryli]
MTASASPTAPDQPSATSEPFGKLDDGTRVDRWTLTAGGTRVRVLTYGGIVQSVEVPDRRGELANVVLGLATLDDYTEHTGPYFGALVGRYANRIRGGAFELDGRTYRLARNNEPNCLHGGELGFDKRVWAAAAGATGDGGVTLTLTRTSPDGEEGFPGNLAVTATYTVTATGALRLDYAATTDAPTVVSLTNHSYWNLDGEGMGSAEAHEVRIDAARYTVNDATSCPTGEFAEVAGTPLDFRTPKPVGRDLREGHPQLLIGQGYDQNYALDKGRTATAEPAAELHSPASGRVLTVATTEPGLQLYTANFILPEFTGTSGRMYRPGDGVALETQHFPDSPNQQHFPSVVLRPGESYASTTEYAFGVR